MNILQVGRKIWFAFNGSSKSLFSYEKKRPYRGSLLVLSFHHIKILFD